MSAFRERPGHAARALLGGDERLHIFRSNELADAYRMRIPGARTYAPRRQGWGNVLHDAITGAIRARDTDVEIEFDQKRERKSASIVLEIAIALYDRGAMTVSISGGLVRMQPKHQQWRAQ